jgi:hypothetical protein
MGRIQVAVGTTFTRGTMFMGYDVAQALDEQYEHARAHRAPPGAEPSVLTGS